MNIDKQQLLDESRMLGIDDYVFINGHMFEKEFNEVGCNLKRNLVLRSKI